jgi:hypothetical protein
VPSEEEAIDLTKIDLENAPYNVMPVQSCSCSVRVEAELETYHGQPGLRCSQEDLKNLNLNTLAG